MTLQLLDVAIGHGLNAVIVVVIPRRTVLRQRPIRKLARQIAIQMPAANAATEQIDNHRQVDGLAPKSMYVMSAAQA